MKKFQEKVQSVGVILMLVFPLCVLLTMLCSDYRGEEEYNQYVTIQQFLVNWYTFITLPIGMLFYSIGWFNFPQKKNRPTTF
jgi:cbb3-type cytochrome oxidase subunit 3